MKGKVLLLLIFLSTGLYAKYMLASSFERKASWLLPAWSFHREISLTHVQNWRLCASVALSVTATVAMGLYLRHISWMRGSDSKHGSLSYIVLNRYAALSGAVALLVALVSLLCSALVSRDASSCLLNFDENFVGARSLIGAFFDVNEPLGRSTGVRVIAGFFGSVLALSFLDPLRCRRLFDSVDVDDDPSPVWMFAVVGLGGMAGVGGVVFLLVTDLIDQSVAGGADRLASFLLDDVQWRYLLPIQLGSMAVALTGYVSVCSALHYRYYVGRVDDADAWKCQPNRWLPPVDHVFEIALGTCNMALASLLTGTLGYLVLFEGLPCALYMRVTLDDLWYVPLSLLVYNVYIELNAYFQHRLFHVPLLYRHFHRVHHIFKAPTAWSATAIHTVEFLLFQSQLMWPAFVVPMHVGAVALSLTYIFAMGLIDHSGVEFKATWYHIGSRVHDDHHRYFHANFGQNTTLLDRWFKTDVHSLLTRRQRSLDEHHHHDQSFTQFVRSLFVN
jgi:Delta7-sterol 5-desaturase